MIIKLKTCPFCGSKAEVVFGDETYYCQCTKYGCVQQVDEYTTRYKSVKAWNIRQ